MTMMTSAASESSVMTSLSELARIERERVGDEELARAREREELAHGEQVRADERRREEDGRIEAARAIEAERQREATDARIRAEARARAAHEVTRIQAAANVQLESDNAVRAHELVVLRSRAEVSGARVQWGLLAALGLVCVAAAVGAYEVNGYVASLERKAGLQREELASAARDHESSRLATLTARDRLEATAYASQRTELLHQRELDLRAWATQARKTDTAATRALTLARRGADAGDDPALHAYESALDHLRDDLSKPGSPPRVRAPVVRASAEPDCRADDPICGVTQRPL